MCKGAWFPPADDTRQDALFCGSVVVKDVKLCQIVDSEIERSVIVWNESSQKNHVFLILFEEVSGQGRHLSIHYRKRRDQDVSRFGVTCSRDRNAVQEIFSVNVKLAILNQLPDAYDFVFGKAYAKDADYRSF